MSELTVGTISGLAANNYVVDVADGSLLTQPGMVLQVVSTVKTDSFATNSSSYVGVDGLSVSITPSSASSKILVLMDVAFSSAAGNFAGIGMTRDGEVLTVGIGGTTLNTIRGSSGNDSDSLFSASIAYLDSPSTTSSVDYQVTAAAVGATTYVNRRGSTTAFSGVSTLTLMEIAQ